MKKIYYYFFMSVLFLSTLCVSVTAFATSKTSQAGITFTGDGSIDTSIVLQLKDKETTKPLAGATFELHDKDGKIVKIDKELKTDEQGEIHLSIKLKPEHYAFVEIQSPKGYQLDTTPVSFEIGFEHPSVTVIAYNQKTGTKPTESSTTDSSTTNTTTTSTTTETTTTSEKKEGEITDTSTNRKQTTTGDSTTNAFFFKVFPKTGTKKSMLSILGIIVILGVVSISYRKNKQKNN